MTEDSTPVYDEPAEYIRQRAPFIVRRIVKWHECDPAGVVYAGNFFNYASSANQLFLGHLMGGPMHQKKLALETDFPAKAIAFVFYSSLRPEEYFDMAVGCRRIGNTTFENQVMAQNLAGKPVFTAQLTSICVVPEVRRAKPVPDPLRAALTRHLIAGPAAPMPMIS